MNGLGKRSVSSLVLVLLNVTAALFAFVLIATSAFVIFATVAGRQLVGPQIDSNGAPNFDIGWNVHMAIPVSFGLGPDTRVTAPALGISSAELRQGQGVLRFVPARAPLLATNVILIGQLAFALWVVTQLRAVFRTLRNGQPFAAANATRVRRLAWAVVGAEVLRSAIVYVANAYAAAHFVADGLRFEAAPHLNLVAIFNGLVILVMAEVFRAGTHLDEEHSLTV